METRLSIVQRKEQTLAMSMTMRMSLALLGMSSEEIDEALKKEKTRNPFLRIPSLPSTAGAAGASGDEGHETLAAEQPVEDDLLQQIGLLRLTAEQRDLAARLVYCLDERGFLADSAADMSSYLGTTQEVLKAIVAKLQMSVEPAGVFAWSLSDCFRIQLLAVNRLDPIILKLLDRLDLVAQQDVQAICDLCAVDAEDAVDMIGEIRGLNPSPLHRVSAAPVFGHEPELVILPRDGGALSVELNPAAFPQVLADDGLFNRVRAVEMNPAAIQYYRDCHKGAAAFVLALQKRANTLLRIGQQVAELQERFLRSGRPLDLQPMTTALLAEALSLNKSTISRALKNCRFMTAHGVKRSEEFLVRPISRAINQKSQDHALHRLSIVIRSEDKRDPYSDLEIASLMSKAGFELSRRTVAKYRDLIGVPGKLKRRSL